jgi:hypothetical protein
VQDTAYDNLFIFWFTVRWEIFTVRWEKSLTAQ